MPRKRYSIKDLRDALQLVLASYRTLYIEAHPMDGLVAGIAFEHLREIKRARKALEGKVDEG